MITVGLTGGIGCGKTTVLEQFRQLGVPCFIADEVAGRYYDDPSFLEHVCHALNADIVAADGSADKRLIASIVFSDKEALERLNALVHPRVMSDFIAWRDSQISPYVIFESAIIYEYGLDRHMDRIIAVYLEKEERLRRLELRDHVTRQALMARMDNQLSAELKMDKADYVVLNYEGNPRSRQVEHIHRLLLLASSLKDDKNGVE